MKIQYLGTSSTVLLWAWLADAHVVMTKPASRNFLASPGGGNSGPALYCPHCLNMGNKNNVQMEQERLGGGSLFQGYPETETIAERHSVCGGTFVGDESFNDNGVWSPLSPVYQGSNPGTWGHNLGDPFIRGGIISFEVEVNAHHLGHFEFYLCDKTNEEDGIDTTTACLNMHRLQRAPDLPAELSPLDPNHPERYYIPPLCALHDTGPALDNPLVQNMRYTLPQDLSCDHCVLQMVYVTANSCNPEGYHNYAWPALSQTCPNAIENGARDWWNDSLQDCASGGYPEEFWNCADIKIVALDGGPAPDSIPNDTPSPTAVPTWASPISASTLSPTSLDGDYDECVPLYGACSNAAGASPCCSGDLEEAVSCREQSQYYSQCLTDIDCERTDWCHLDTDAEIPIVTQTPTPNDSSPPATVPTQATPTVTPTLLPTPFVHSNDGQCVPLYGACSSIPGASPCCQGDSGEVISCRVQSQYYSQCLSDNDCERTDWCHVTAEPIVTPTASPQPPTHNPTASPQPPTVSPPPTTAAPTTTFTTAAVGDSYDRFIEFLDELTSTLESNDSVRVVHSSGGAAGGVVSEGQGYGLLIGGATAASLSSAMGARSEAFDYSVEMTLQLFRGWQQMCVLSDTSASCQLSGPLCTYFDGESGSSPVPRQVPCLPHWKFNDELGVVEGTGAAVDGDEDAILGMILLLKAVEPFLSDGSGEFAWYDEVAQWTYESSEAFYSFNTIASASTGARVVRLGSCWGGWDCNNPSYHAPAAMKAMRDFVQNTAVDLGFVDVSVAATYAQNIDAVIDVTYQILLANQCPSNGLTTNWYVPDEQDPTQTGTTGCSGSGTPAAEFGSEASRGVWRVVLDYMLYSDNRAVEYLRPLTQNVVNQYHPVQDQSNQWDDLDFQTTSDSGCLVDSVHASWQWNAFMFGPVFTSLTVPQDGASGIDLDLQMSALESAAARIERTAISDYYSGSWIALSTLTLNGDFVEAGSLLGLPNSSR